MQTQHYSELIRILTSDLSDSEKKEKLLQYHENDIAVMLLKLNPEQRGTVFRLLGMKYTARLFLYIDDIEELSNDFSSAQMAEILETTDVGAAVRILDKFSMENRAAILSAMSRGQREQIQSIQQYDETCIGRKITNNYVAILNTDTVKTATKKVIAKAAEHDNISNIYVLDKRKRFCGVVDLRNLIIARENDDLASITKQNYPYFYADEQLDKCLIKFKEYGLDSYPILNRNQTLIGVITLDDVVEVVDDELEDDYAKLAGLTEAEDGRDSVVDSIRKRMPWLIIVLVLGLFQCFAMTAFERVVVTIPILVFFQTLVLAMSGNSGTQSLAVTIRSLSKHTDGKRRVLKIAFKELRAGIINGLALSILAFILVFLFMFVTKQSIETETYYAQDAIKASGIVSVSLWIAMTISSCLGTALPILFSKIRIDPAVACGPFITTLCDIMALFVYYGLAYLFFMTF